MFNYQSKDPNWWERRPVLLLIVLAMTVPLLWPSFPPLVDLPGHMGRYKVQLDGALSPSLSKFYRFEWQLIGNLGVDLLMEPLGRIFGIELATKLIVITIPPLTAIGLIWTAKEIHGQISGSVFFALPLAYSYPFNFGFVNFALSIALALISFGLWLRLMRLEKLRLRAMIFIPIGLILWVCHIFGWAFLGLLAFSAELTAQRDKRTSFWNGVFRAGLQCLPLAPPVILMMLWRSGDNVAGGTRGFFSLSHKGLWFFRVLADRWSYFDVASLGAMISVFYVAFRSKNIEFSRNLRLTSSILFLAFILLPNTLFGSAYADMRLLPMALAIALIAIRPIPSAGKQIEQMFAICGLVFLVVRLGANTVSYFLYSERQAEALVALDHVPRHARLVSFVTLRCDKWLTNRLEHIPGMAIVRREAFSNDQWVMGGAQLIRVNMKMFTFINRDPSEIVFRRKCYREHSGTLENSLLNTSRREFEYLWLLDHPNPNPKSLIGWEKVWSNGKDHVYKVRQVVPPLTAR